MPVSDQVPYISALANGGDTYNFNFKIFDNTDLVVKVNGVEKTLGTDYTVTIDAEPSEGGSVVFLVGKLPADGTDLVEVERQVSLERSTDYQESGGFRQSVVDKDFDRIVMLIQDRERRLGVTETDIETLKATLSTIGETAPAYGTRTVALDYQVAVGDRFILVDASGGDVTVTLMDSDDPRALDVSVKRRDGSDHVVKVVPAAGDQLEDGDEYELANKWAGATFRRDGVATWTIF